MKNLFLSFFILLSLGLLAQDGTIGLPLINNYSSIDFRGHYQNWDATQDDDGILYFANGDGLMIFDGVEWEMYKLPNEVSPRSVEISKSGKIYVAGRGFLGYFSPDSVNSLVYTSIMHLLPEKYNNDNILWDIQINNEIIYARTYLYIIKIEGDKADVFELKEKSFNIFVSTNNNVFISYSQNNIYSILSNDSLRNYNFKESIIGFFEKNDTVFFATSNNFIYYFDENLVSHKYLQLNYDFSNLSLNNVKLYHDKLLFLSVNEGVFFFDFKGRLLLHLNKETGLINNNTTECLIDRMNNIWLSTGNGISHVEMASPVKMLDSRFDFEYGQPLFVNYFEDKMITCTGFKIYELLFQNNTQVILNELQKAEGQSWGGMQIGNEFYIARNQSILRLDKTGNTKIYGPQENIWSIKKVPFGEDNYILGGTGGLFYYKYDGDSLKFQHKIEGFDKSARELKFHENELWIATDYSGIYKITFSDSITIINTEFYGTEKGLFNSISMYLYEWKDLLLISTFKTLFYYDTKSDSIQEFSQITDKFNTDGDKVLQLIYVDNLDNFWFEYYDNNFESEIFCFKEQDGEFVETNFFAKKMLNYGIAFFFNVTDDLLIAGSSRGYALLDCKSQYNSKIPFKVLVRKVYYSSKDSLLYGGYVIKNNKIIHELNDDKKLIIEFKNNNLRFVYAAPFFIDSKKIKYRVKLVNYDKDWSRWTYETKKDYTNLPPGNYTLMIEAINIYGQVSEQTKFSIYVKYPWYRTIYAYIVYLIFLIIFLYVIVQFFTLRLQRRNQKLEEQVGERTQQIKQKNTELEQQTEEILTQAEELQIVNQELEKLSIIARETDNAIILADKDGNFIWVNHAYTKIFGYTFEELANKICPNLIADTTEERVKKIVNRCLKKKITVEYELKVKNKFGEDIWVHTTLTPLLDDEKQITSLVAIDADITLQKKSEKQILEQSEMITASIRYAVTIQESILPSKDEIGDLFDSFIIYKPKDIVSGDFYWVSNIFETNNNQLKRVRKVKNGLDVGQTVFFAAVDCTGHGVPGAFMSLIGSRLLGEIVNEQRVAKPRNILYHLDSKLGKALKRSKKTNYDGMVVSICRMDKILENNEEVLKITFSGAKQHITYYSQKTKEFIKVRGSARQIGFVVNEDLEFIDTKFTLYKGDSLFLYSDGLKDLNNPQRRSFGHYRIIEFLKQNIEKPISEIGYILENEMTKWLADEHQRDDILFVGLRMF